MKKILSSYRCNFSDDTNTVSSRGGFQHLHENKKIEGPNKISKSDCEDYARGTARACRYLIAFVKSTKTQVALNILIDDLERQAINCCWA